MREEARLTPRPRGNYRCRQGSGTDSTGEAPAGTVPDCDQANKQVINESKHVFWGARAFVKECLRLKKKRKILIMLPDTPESSLTALNGLQEASS